MYNFYFKKITLILIYPYFVFLFELDGTTEVGVGLGWVTWFSIYQEKLIMEKIKLD